MAKILQFPKSRIVRKVPKMKPEVPNVNKKQYDPRSDCVREQALLDQAKLPIALRSKTIMISCPCARCNPYFF